MAKMKVTFDDNEYISVKDAFEEFVEEKQAINLSPKSIHNYEQSLEYFLLDEFDSDWNIDVNEIQRIYVEQWKASMLQQGKKITTINHYVRDLRAFLYWCMDDSRKYIEPAYKIECAKGQEPLPKSHTQDEVELLLKPPVKVNDVLAVWTEWRMWTIANLVVATGMRAQTICSLLIGDADFNNKEINLRHTKNKNASKVPMTPALEAVLKQYIRRCRKGEPSGAWLFPNAEGNQLSYSALAHAFSKYCKERGVEHTNIHGLRHYFGTSLSRAGYSAEKIQMLLGHSTYSTTQNYIKLTNKDLQTDFEQFNPLDTMKRNNTRSKRVRMS